MSSSETTSATHSRSHRAARLLPRVGNSATVGDYSGRGRLGSVPDCLKSSRSLVVPQPVLTAFNQTTSFQKHVSTDPGLCDPSPRSNLVHHIGSCFCTPSAHAHRSKRRLSKSEWPPCKRKKTRASVPNGSSHPTIVDVGDDAMVETPVVDGNLGVFLTLGEREVRLPADPEGRTTDNIKDTFLAHFASASESCFTLSSLRWRQPHRGHGILQ